MNLNSFLLNAYKKNGQSSENVQQKKLDKTDRQSTKTNNNIVNRQIIGEKASVKSSYMGDEQILAASKALTSGGLLKVPKLPNDKDGRESVYRRVAKFLLLIGVDEASKILPHLTEEQTEKIIPEIASIQRVDPEEAESIMAEFQNLFLRARDDGGIDTAKEMLVKAFGQDKAQEILNNATNSLPVDKPFEYLQEADSDKVSQLLKNESNAVKSLVLSYLKPVVSAEVIKSLPADDKKDVILRLAGLDKINPEVLRAVDKAMQEKMRKVTIQKSDLIDGRSALAQILKRMDPSMEEELLSTLSEQDAELGEDLKKRLFTTEDIVAADDKFIQEYLRKMDDNDIAYLIAAKDESFRSKILKNVSQTRRNLILEVEEINKPMRRVDVEKVTSEFISDMHQAYNDGILIVDGRDGEIYV